MTDERKITRAVITALPKQLFDPLPKVIATLEDGSEEELFTYYSDELTFTPAEFIGLTVAQARRLKFTKDLAYLRS